MTVSLEKREIAPDAVTSPLTVCAVIAPVWALVEDRYVAYHVTLALNAVLMSLAAIPAYFLARLVVSRGSSLLVATMTSPGPVAAGPETSDTIVNVVDPIDPEVILPSRVDAALRRTLAAMERASASVDDRQPRAAIAALTAARLNVTRAQLAGTRQVQAVPPPDTEEESTAGPDSVLAILNVDQVVITQLAGLFDRQSGVQLSAALKSTLNLALARRAEMLTLVLGLNEEKGAPYLDVLIDTVPNYADEVANITEAIADDHLSAANKKTLQAALTKSKAANAQVLKAFPVED